MQTLNAEKQILRHQQHAHRSFAVLEQCPWSYARRSTSGHRSLQIMRQLGRNMAFMIKSIALGKEKYGLPKQEEWIPTHFIR